MFERVKESIASKMRSFLKIYTANGTSFNINELLDFDSNVAVNKIWFRGESYELSQLYKQLDDNQFGFWGSVPTQGIEIRKIHTGLPKTMVNIMSGVVADDMQDVEFGSEAHKSLWKQIAEENVFNELVKEAISKVLYTGDGAFKISIDTDISQLPIIEFFEADRISLTRKRGRITEIIFKTAYTHDTNTFVLHEIYGNGYIKYELKNAFDKFVELDSVPSLAGLQNIEWDGDFMLAEYIRFYTSDKFEGRGQSVFDAKRDNFDALDESWSQWIDALRAGRTQKYIPENLIPRNPNTGELMRANSFDNRFIKLASTLTENDNSKVSTESAIIQHESYLSTYITALDLCLQGFISPSTLGIDVKKLDNAEAQREKEKATLYTRQTIVTALQIVLPALIKNVFNAYNTMNLTPLEGVECDVAFGEYANPSFESQVVTVGKAKTYGIMSIEASVDELYGNSRDDEWKKEEVARLKAEHGVIEMQEPSLALDLEEEEI